MRPGGGKQKGDGYERQVAKLIGTWWCNDKHAFGPPAGSGSIVTRRPETEWHPGDLEPKKQLKKPFVFAIECKKTEQWTFESIIKPVKSELIDEYWKKAISNVENSKGSYKRYEPWLFFSRNFLGAHFLAMRPKYFFGLGRVTKNIPYIRVKLNEHRLIVVDWSTFTEHVSTDLALKTFKQIRR